MVLIAIIILTCVIVERITFKKDWIKEERRMAVIITACVASGIILPIAFFAPLAGCEEMQCV